MKLQNAIYLGTVPVPHFQDHTPMPQLPNARHEAFAQARAKGASLDDAYEDAGFVHGHRHGARMAQKPDIAARIAELRACRSELDDAATPSVIARLLRLAKAAEADTSPGALREIRLTLLEAERLRAEMARQRDYERPSRHAFEMGLEKSTPYAE
jgi:hypothetical protein